MIHRREFVQKNVTGDSGSTEMVRTNDGKAGGGIDHQNNDNPN